NVEGAIQLARLAQNAGVKRFVFLSSIGVHGSHCDGLPFTETSPMSPHAAYAVSKWEAETALWDVVNGSGMELVIIRPPLVYAGHAPGNFGRLLRLIARGVPIPLGGVTNSRSMIALENLVDFIDLCTRHSAAANETFVIADGVDISTPEIISNIAHGMNMHARLVRVPLPHLRAATLLAGKSGLYTQLCKSLTVDASKARTKLGWRPVIGTPEALRQAGMEFACMHNTSQ